MTLDEMDKAEAEEAAKSKQVRQLPPLGFVPNANWRAALWTPMAHRNLCLTCRYGKAHSHTECLDPAKCQCPCFAWKGAMDGHGMD